MPEPAPLRPGDPGTIGGYTLTGRLGFGGQGVVYLAHDASGTPVALKVLHADMASDEDMLGRFLREISSAKQVARFCTAQVLAVDVDGDQPYVVSEYVDGPSLAVLVNRDGPRRGAALERLAIGMATALAAIHQAGIIHRDFKPGNVLVGPDGPRVIDFGISRALDVSMSLTGGQAVGTPAYMAPEQFHAERIGPAIDVFAFGGTLTYAATGQSPFGSDTLGAVMNRILTQPPELGELSGPLRDVAIACLAKDPADRPDARELLLALLDAGQTQPTEDPLLALARGRTAATTDATLAGAAGTSNGALAESAPAQNPASRPHSPKGAVDLPDAATPHGTSTNGDHAATATTDPPDGSDTAAADGSHQSAGSTDGTGASATGQSGTDRGRTGSSGTGGSGSGRGRTGGGIGVFRGGTGGGGGGWLGRWRGKRESEAEGLSLTGPTASLGRVGARATAPGRRRDRRVRNGVLAGAAALVTAGVLVTVAVLADSGRHPGRPIASGSPRSQGVAVVPTSGSASTSPTRSRRPASPSTTAGTTAAAPTTGRPRRASHPVTTPPVRAGTLMVEHSGLPMGSDWTTVTDAIMAVNGPVTWTATAGPHLRVSPTSGQLAKDAEAELVINHTDATTSGSSTVTITGERGSVTITVTWGT